MTAVRINEMERLNIAMTEIRMMNGGINAAGGDSGHKAAVQQSPIRMQATEWTSTGNSI
jgi:hypothetical protein